MIYIALFCVDSHYSALFCIDFSCWLVFEAIFYQFPISKLPTPQTFFCHLDLLVQRHTEQKEIFGFLDDEKGAIFIANQLAITQSFIEEVKPKCILVFNKFAANFFGKNAKKDRKGKCVNVWIGYKFKPVEGIKDVFKITGLQEADGRINPHLKETNLIGTIVYFSRHLGRYTAKKYMEEVEKDLEWIGKELL